MNQLLRHSVLRCACQLISLSVFSYNRENYPEKNEARRKLQHSVDHVTMETSRPEVE